MLIDLTAYYDINDIEVDNPFIEVYDVIDVYINSTGVHNVCVVGVVDNVIYNVGYKNNMFILNKTIKNNDTLMYRVDKTIKDINGDPIFKPSNSIELLKNIVINVNKINKGIVDEMSTGYNGVTISKPSLFVGNNDDDIVVKTLYLLEIPDNTFKYEICILYNDTYYATDIMFGRITVTRRNIPEHIVNISKITEVTFNNTPDFYKFYNDHFHVIG